MIKLAFFTFLSLVFEVRADSIGICLRKENTLNTSNFLDVLKISQIGLAQSDMTDFCKRNMILRYLNSQKMAPKNCETLSIKELEALVPAGDTSPWLLSLLSTKESRVKAVTMPGWGNESSQVEIKKGTDLNKINDKINSYFGQSSNLIDDITFNAKVIAFCAKDNLGSALECRKNLSLIYEQAKPIGDAKLMTPEAWKFIYSSNLPNKGLHNLALKLKNELQENLAGGKKQFSKSRNIFDDLVGSFTSSGLNKKDAEEAAWSTLAIISNGGQNTLVRAGVIDQSLSQKSFDIDFIARAIGLIDYIKQSEKSPMYSYPNNVKTDCDNAKYYHFWMSAYLSRYLVKNKGIASEKAIKSAYQTQIAYQMNRALAGDGAGKSSSVVNATPYGPIHQIIRTDLAYSAAGATYGTNTNSKNIDVNENIIKLLTKAGSKSKELGTELSDIETMTEWEKIFSPQAVFDK